MEIVAIDFLYKNIWSFLDANADLVVPDDRKRDPYSEGLWLWKQMQIHISHPPARKSFELTLSEAQYKSWRILDEWWNATYHHAKPDDNAATLDLLKAEGRSQEEHPDPANATYGSCLAYLCVVEMVWYSSIKQLDQVPAEQLQPQAKAILRQINDKVKIARRRALKQAVCQIVAHASYQEMEKLSPSKSEKMLLGATLEACPWLTTKIEINVRKPLYLWDRFSRKSIKTESLSEGDMEYYCISHTWGRWRKKHPVNVPHVNWLVPANTRFDVQSLPEAFQRLEWPVQYLWFDLFCIPQEKCSEQAEEIGKQAEIFSRAKCTVIWMHDVLDWTVLENNVVWLGLNYLRHTAPEDPIVQGHYEKFTKKLQEESSSLAISKDILDPWVPVPPDGPRAKEELEKLRNDPGSRWFSSLWTLQEAYLCPSSLLADQQWNILSIKERLFLPLDNIATLAYSLAAVVDEPKKRPGEVETLIFTIKRWELNDLTSPSRMSILIAAESRQSSSPRAQAIMSATGITDWYEDYRKKNGRAHPQDKLIFHSYPYEFLVEAQHKIGGPFFLHLRQPSNTIQDAEFGEPLGTLLPFAHNKKHWQVTQSLNLPATDWSMSLTDHWEIQLDGSVIIMKASVLAGTGHQTSPGTEGPVSLSSPDGLKHFESFRAWIDDLPDVPYRFAIAAVRYGRRQFGITAEGVVSMADESRLILVKTGIFMTEGNWCREDLVESSEVDWVIL